MTDEFTRVALGILFRPEGCTCQFGRASDGSEHGPCEWCEEQMWREENGMTDADLEAMMDGSAEGVEEDELWLA